MANYVTFSSKILLTKVMKRLIKGLIKHFFTLNTQLKIIQHASFTCTFMQALSSMCLCAFCLTFTLWRVHQQQLRVAYRARGYFGMHRTTKRLNGGWPALPAAPRPHFGLGMWIKSLCTDRSKNKSPITLSFKMKTCLGVMAKILKVAVRVNLQLMNVSQCFVLWIIETQLFACACMNVCVVMPHVLCAEQAYIQLIPARLLPLWPSSV